MIPKKPCPMKMYGIEYHLDVKKKDLPKIDPDIQMRIRKAIEERIMTAPDAYGLPLRKTLKGYWKIRVGDYRIVYKISGQKITVLCICHRREVYQTAARR